jgi:hypothetical protein
MERILFVTGSAGGVGVGDLQHWVALRKSIGGSGNVLNASLMRAVTMSLPSEILHTDLLANRLDAIPDENNITVHRISGKSQTVGARGTKFQRLVCKQIRQRLCSVSLVKQRAIQMQVNL